MKEGRNQERQNSPVKAGREVKVLVTGFGVSSLTSIILCCVEIVMHVRLSVLFLWVSLLTCLSPVNNILKGNNVESVKEKNPHLKRSLRSLYHTCCQSRTVPRNSSICCYCSCITFCTNTYISSAFQERISHQPFRDHRFHSSSNTSNPIII